MPQRMRTDFLFYTCIGGSFLNNQENHLATETFAAFIQKYNI
jgi:hypothetical protein